MMIKGTRIPYRLVDGYVEEYGEEFKKELLNDYPYISQEQLDNYLINLYEQNKRYRKYLELIKTIGTHGKDIKTGEIIRSDEANLADEALEGDE